MKTCVSIIICLFILSSNSFSNQASHASLRKLFTIIKLQASSESHYVKIREITAMKLTNLLDTTRSFDEKVKYVNRRDRLLRAYDSAFTWENFEPVLIEAYQKEFSEEEVQSLISFFNSPVGQKYLHRNSSILDECFEKVYDRIRNDNKKEALQ